jgi:hypothetical protein
VFVFVSPFSIRIFGITLVSLRSIKIGTEAYRHRPAEENPNYGSQYNAMKVQLHAYTQLSFK